MDVLVDVADMTVVLTVDELVDETVDVTDTLFCTLRLSVPTTDCEGRDAFWPSTV